MNWHQINPISLVDFERLHLVDHSPQAFKMTLVVRLKSLQLETNNTPHIQGELTAYSACGHGAHFEVDFSCFFTNAFRARSHAEFLINQSYKLWVVEAHYLYDEEDGKITVLDPDITPIELPSPYQKRVECIDV